MNLSLMRRYRLLVVAAKTCPRKRPIREVRLGKILVGATCRSRTEIPTGPSESVTLSRWDVEKKGKGSDERRSEHLVTNGVKMGELRRALHVAVEGRFEL